jgi:nucleotide-binding universal stress UspA family protein
MNTSPIKKLLVPLDGSERSLETVRFLAATDEFRKANLVLFHVFNAVPECYWDLAKEPKSVKVVPPVLAWQSHQKTLIEQYLSRAREMLTEAGYPANAVRTVVHHRKDGIARDILTEAKKAYDAVVIRRRGFTLIPEIIMGSVATKIIQKLTYKPIIIAGIRPRGDRAILAFDGSPGAMRAVAFAGRILKHNAHHLRLLYVMRGVSSSFSDDLFAPKEWCEAAKERMDKAFGKAIQALSDLGVAGDRISCQTIEGARSRAAAIYEAAAAGDYGTIIVGRRGRSSPRRFFLGRVGDKVIHLARERTVWVVN